MSKSQIDRYAFKVPLLFEGDRGSGKTFDVREFARAGKMRYMEIAGHESVEAIDFLGHPMQSEHGVVWKDGKLSQAFRSARDGHSTVLLIDEMLRIPQRHLSVLLSALSPDSEGHYRLQTGRMVGVVDGVGVEEEIVVPTSKLAIFATTNVGPEFAIDELDPAVAERFIIVRKDTEKAQLTQILQTKAATKSFNKLVAVRLVELFDKTRRMVDTGTLNRHATTRTLARALEHADSENDVKQILKDQILLWVDRDSSGKPVSEQVKLLERAIEDLFPDVTAKAAESKPKAARGRSTPSASPSSTPSTPALPPGVSAGMSKADLVKALMLARLRGDASEASLMESIHALMGEPEDVSETPSASETARSCSLAFKDATSDKVYNIELTKSFSKAGAWDLKVSYGRRGAAKLSESLKLEGVSRALAESEFDKLRSAKIAKGYNESSSGAPKSKTRKI